MDQELFAYLDESFRSLRDDIDQRFEAIEKAIRGSQATSEGLREDLGLFCGAVIDIDDRLKRFEERVRRELENELAGLRNLVSPSYSALDHRVRILEIHKELRERDPIELIRERFGLGPAPARD